MRTLVAAMLGAVLLAGCGSHGSDRADDGCPDTTIVGVRGQGQSLDANDGLGTEVHAIAEALSDELGGVVEIEAVRHHSAVASDLDQYVADVGDGRRLLRKALRSEVAACPDSRLVVIGFSQGSQIAREELAARARLARDVDLLVLVGSPVRDPGSPFRHVRLAGGLPTAGGSLGAGPDLGDLSARTVEACVAGDVVCAHDGTSADYTIHQHAYEDPWVVEKITAAAAAQVG